MPSFWEAHAFFNIFHPLTTLTFSHPMSDEILRNVSKHEEAQESRQQQTFLV
jgi:hypothetical protein